jgi:tetratricopeptide (TPR) repeat protein/predicted Ser/Thr protein kinase
MTTEQATERWLRIDRILQPAFDLPVAEREAYLDAACAGDTDLRREVESLLAADEEADDFLVEPVFKLAAPDRSVAAGHRIGAYRVVRELGRGGMGAVYLAERADNQFEQQVAIKLVKRGMDTDEIVRRFRHERQILASLDHPNIARLFDGGSTEDGRPYFVMEYVAGRPLLEYCDQRRLDTTERLKLFLQVCAAVQHAHNNFVVHRDIKPSNILITGGGEVKLLDFGIAKLLNAEEAGLTSAIGQRPMTPEYASPEQACGQNLTTASDVYALGVVLYELLTGHRPYQVNRATNEEVVRVICHQEPERPSVVVSDAPDKLRRRLSGDLDNIVLTALRKEPERRYQSAAQLAEDIQRHLKGQPVAARPNTLGYRTGKFIRRNKTAVAAAALILLSLLGGMAATMRQMLVARDERDRAEAQRLRAENEQMRAEAQRLRAENEQARAEREQAHAVEALALARRAEAQAQVERARAVRRFNDVRKLANTMLFEFHDAIKNLAGSLPAQELLVKRALEYLDSLAREASGDASLQRELAAGYDKVGDLQGMTATSGGLGDTAAALRSYRKALAIRQALVAANPANTSHRLELALSFRNLGESQRLNWQREQSVESYRRAISILEPLLEGEPQNLAVRQELLFLYQRISQALRILREEAGARQYDEKAQTLSERLPEEAQVKPFAPRYAVVAKMMARSARQRQKGDREGALESYQQVIALAGVEAAKNPGDVIYQRHLAYSHSLAGELLAEKGKVAEAMEHHRQSLAILEALSAKDPTNAVASNSVTSPLVKMAALLEQTGDLRRALEHYRQAAALREELMAKDPHNPGRKRSLAGLHLRISDLSLATGDRAEAVMRCRKALKIYEALVALNPGSVQDRRSLTTVSKKLAVLLMTDDERRLENDRRLVAEFTKLANDQAKRGDAAGAIENYRKALAALESPAAIRSADTTARLKISDLYRRLADQLRRAGDHRGAMESYRKMMELAEAVVIVEPANSMAREYLSTSHYRIGDMLARNGDSDGALAHFRSMLALRQALATEKPSNAQAQIDLAFGYLRFGELYAILGGASAIPASKRVEHWREARSWYQRSLAVLLDLGERGLLPAERVATMEMITREIAKCDAALAEQPSQSP